ncbi:MAG: methylmalonyl Co-A mutase-associated GTPase MeaB [Candidatus Competibacterales bacterium]|nr:methylmalonyl Co-A mutase-associated GTPase MeaB [Candidatus Competibacterales bacterium]
MTPEALRALAESVRAGRRRALARAITLIESSRTDHQETAERLLTELLPDTGNSIRLAISGSPGVGKSTFIESFGRYLIEQGHRVAVLAVDPSSARSGGSILGDKTRMEQLARESRAFIRPAPAGRTLGGVARRTRESLLVCEAAGFDVIVVETVGVGQSEIAVAEMTDMFLLLLLPGGGDDLQGIKRGIMELADLVLVNKADGELLPAARRAAMDYGQALRLMAPRAPRWRTPVKLCSALEGSGIEAVWEAVCEYRSLMQSDGVLERRRAEQARAWLWQELREGLLQALRADPRIGDDLRRAETAVTAGEQPAPLAARELLRRFLGTPPEYP